jgi:hypothetical protein
MKKTSIIRMTLALVAFVLIAAAAYAGSVGGRQFVTLAVTPGAGTLTVAEQYQVLDLKRISVEGSINATNVITASRVIADAAGTLYTQTVGSVTCAAGVGTQATLAHTLLKYGDTLRFSSLVSTGSTVIVEYEVQEH